MVSSNGKGSGTTTATTTGGGSALDLLKSKLSQLKSSLSSRDQTIMDLRRQLSEQVPRDLERAREEASKGVREELEPLLESAQKRSEQLLKDKAELQQTLSKLEQQMTKLSETERQDRQQWQQELLARELEKAKSEWDRVEAANRKKMLAEHTSKVKKATLAQMEEHVRSRLLKVENEKVAEIAHLQMEHSSSIAQIRRDQEEELSKVRKQHSAEIEAARIECQQQAMENLRTTIEKYDKMMQEQKDRFQSDLDRERRRSETSSAQVSSMVSAAVSRARADHEMEIRRLKQRHEQELEDLQRSHASQVAQLRTKIALEKDGWSSALRKKFDEDYRRKLEDIRRQLQVEQEEEIGMILKRVSEETEGGHRELVKSYEMKLDTQRRQFQSDLSSLRRQLDAAQSELKDVQEDRDSLRRTHHRCEGRLHTLQEEVTNLTRKLRAASETIEQHQSTIRSLEIDATTQKLSAQERNQLLERIRSLESSLADSRHSMSSLQQSHSDALQNFETTHAQMLAQMQQRVAELVRKKESIIEQLQRKISQLEEEARNALVEEDGY